MGVVSSIIPVSLPEWGLRSGRYNVRRQTYIPTLPFALPSPEAIYSNPECHSGMARDMQSPVEGGRAAVEAIKSIQAGVGPEPTVISDNKGASLRIAAREADAGYELTLTRGGDSKEYKAFLHSSGNQLAHEVHEGQDPPDPMEIVRFDAGDSPAIVLMVFSEKYRFPIQ